MRNRMLIHAEARVAALVCKGAHVPAARTTVIKELTEAIRDIAEFGKDAECPDCYPPKKMVRIRERP